MLKAWLHHKFRSLDEQPDGSLYPTQSAFSREDPLTSSVFERFNYLDACDAWSMLFQACDGDDRANLAAPFHSGLPEWHFWRSFAPGPLGQNRQRVEPDVVVTWGDVTVVVEAKHGSSQDPAQWLEQLSAVRSNPAFARQKIVYVAAGGVDNVTFERLVRKLSTTTCARDVTFLLMRWSKLREIVESRHAIARHPASAVLRDMLAALEAWGCRPSVEFGTLSKVAATLHITTTPANIAHWRVT